MGAGKIFPGQNNYYSGRKREFLHKGQGHKFIIFSCKKGLLGINAK